LRLEAVGVERANNWFRDHGSSLIDLHAQAYESVVRSAARRCASRRVDRATSLPGLERHRNAIRFKKVNHVIFLGADLEAVVSVSPESLNSRVVCGSALLAGTVLVMVETTDLADEQRDKEADERQHVFHGSSLLYEHFHIS